MERKNLKLKKKTERQEGWKAKGEWSVYQEEEIVMKCGHTKKVKTEVRKTWDQLQTKEKEKQINQRGVKDQNY